MNKEEKKKRDNEVVTEGNKTPEGRLKIEAIEEYKDSADDYKLNAKFYGLASVIEIIIRIIYCNTMNKEGILRLVPINLIPLAVYIYRKMKMDKRIYNLEEEILNSKTK